MKEIAFALVVLCFGCGSKEYPEQHDLHNHLLEYSTMTFHHQSIEQLSNLLKQDSVRYSDILELRSSTSELIKFIDDTQDRMIEVSGGYNENGLYFNPHSKEQIETLMIREGLATKLKTQLDDYSDLLKSYGLKQNQISINPQQNPLLKHDPKYNAYSFERLHFEDADLVESISALQMYKSAILLNEGLTINLMLFEKCSP
ncbi:MAG: hypothetical protein RIF36_23480 [Imperialibacter sp.]|uniref:hypothetical protein n=1 Tax=Imperialibacter sp. TaxID=2038411 RepID=UPI0032EF645C